MSASDGGYVLYGDVIGNDEASWFTTVPGHSTITFTELPQYTPVYDQYADLGVLFTDTDGNWIYADAPTIFTLDDCGLHGNVVVEMTFDTPMWALAAHFPGARRFDFYMGDELLFASPYFSGGPGHPGVGAFAGFTTDTPFDRVRIHGLPPDQFGNPHYVLIDNFYFAAVPGPAGFAVMALAGLTGSRRRR